MNNKITKTVQRSEELYIQFTEEEMNQLGIKPNDKFACKVDKDSIILEKYVPVEIDIEDWDRQTLLFLIEESLDKNLPVEDIISDVLTKAIEDEEFKQSNKK